MEVIINPQSRHVTHLQRAELSYTNRGTRKDSAHYINHCLSVKRLIHLPHGPQGWRVRQLFKKQLTEKTAREVIRAK